MKLNLRCPCGSDQFVLDDLDNPGNPPKPGSRIRCNACGQVIRLPAVQEVADATHKLVTDRLRKALKKR